MYLAFEASLSEPPSSITSFRDATLLASVFCEMDVIVESPPGMRSQYLKWLRNNGAFDFIEDIVLAHEHSAFKIGTKESDLVIQRLDQESLSFVAACLWSLKS